LIRNMKGGMSQGDRGFEGSRSRGFKGVLFFHGWNVGLIFLLTFKLIIIEVEI